METTNTVAARLEGRNEQCCDRLSSDRIEHGSTILETVSAMPPSQSTSSSHWPQFNQLIISQSTSKNFRILVSKVRSVHIEISVNGSFAGECDSVSNAMRGSPELWKGGRI